jgi:GNAT superfamily N-acetyltransferase
MIEIRIRPPRPGDGAGAAIAWCDSADFYQEIAPESFQAPRRDGLDAWLEARLLTEEEDRLVRVADRDGASIGFVGARYVKPNQDAERQIVRATGLPRIFVNALAVQRAHWRSGAGTELMNAVEHWAREHDAHLITLEAFADSPVSVPFYERRMGYRRHEIVFAKQLR